MPHAVGAVCAAAAARPAAKASPPLAVMNPKHWLLLLLAGNAAVLLYQARWYLPPVDLDGDIEFSGGEGRHGLSHRGHASTFFQGDAFDRSEEAMSRAAKTQSGTRLFNEVRQHKHCQPEGADKVFRPVQQSGGLHVIKPPPLIEDLQRIRGVPAVLCEGNISRTSVGSLSVVYNVRT